MPKAKKIPKKKLKKSVKPENYFYTVDGRVIKNLFQLAKEMETMANEVFSHHVNNEKNDFSNWVRDIFEQPRLAKEIQDTKDPQTAHTVILKYLVKFAR